MEWNEKKAENPLLQSVPPLTFWRTLKSLGYRLWDEENRRMVSFDALRELEQKQAAG